jgi:hypothetical protein
LPQSTTGALILDASISLTGTTSSSGIGLQIDAADNYNTYPWISMSGSLPLSTLD